MFVGAMTVSQVECLPITIAETATFAKKVDQLLPTEEERAELFMTLASNPELGALVSGTGGLRKARWGARGRGKRGGIRVLYLFAGYHMPLFMIACFSKSEMADLDPATKALIADLVAELKASYATPSAQLKLVE